MTAPGRPRTLRSTTTKLATERGSLFVTVCVDDDGRPVEVLGSLGKAGSPEHGMVETTCRLISLHLRRGTPLSEIVGQCRGIGEMQPWPNRMPGGRTGPGEGNRRRHRARAAGVRQGRRRAGPRDRRMSRSATGGREKTT